MQVDQVGAEYWQLSRDCAEHVSAKACDASAQNTVLKSLMLAQ